jgi:nucleoside-diphosphate-sugar epimerase
LVSDSVSEATNTIIAKKMKPGFCASTAGVIAGMVAAGITAGAAAYVYHCATRKRRVVITGGCGNLGSKLAKKLLLSRKYEVVLLEHPHHVKPVPEGATLVTGDLADGTSAWTGSLKWADSVVHFSAVNPYPNATWADSAGSMAHTFNVCMAAWKWGVRRVVFASSNHVMGGYKDLPDVTSIKPTSPPRCGTLPYSPT